MAQATDTDAQIEVWVADQRQALEADMRAVMATKPGQRFAHWVIHELCDLQGVSTSRFERAAAMHDGRRAAGVELFETLTKLAPESVASMLIDHINTASTYQALRARQGDRQ